MFVRESRPVRWWLSLALFWSLEACDRPGAGGAASWTNGIPPLHTEGRVFKDPAGRTVVLRGVAMADPLDLDNRGEDMDSARLLARLTDASDGFYARVVRMTVFPKIWKVDPEAYFRDHLAPAVSQATAHGLYVIIDWHEIADVETVADETTAFWKTMAPRFAHQTNILYELFNEPVNQADPSWGHWKQYAQPWVDQIRADAPERPILIGGPVWSQQIGGAEAAPFTGGNLAYVGHIYPNSATYAGVLDDSGPIAQAARTRPVFITEWGFRDTGDPVTSGTQTSFGEPLKAFIEAHGLSWTAWCADDMWAPVMFDTDWNLLEGEGEMGGFVRDWLAQRKDDDRPTGLGPSRDAATPDAGAPADGPPPKDAATVTDAAPTADARRDAIADAQTGGELVCCAVTATGPGSEACPCDPRKTVPSTCVDVGRQCDYPSCGDLVSCTCSLSVDGSPSWQCSVLLR